MGGCAIGICAAIERVRWGGWDEVVTMAPRSYVAAVQAAGALALLLPPDDAVAEAPDRLLDRIDALILAGGSDVDPATYGARRHPETNSAWPERDRFELALARRALERELPVLGICRGMQLLNVALGGTLAQHLPNVVGHDGHNPRPGVYGTVTVELDPAGRVGALLGASVDAQCHHHQAIDRLADGLLVTGRAGDGTIEAVELADRDFVLGVQWHPEQDDLRLFRALVAAARAR
jgi:gamma-glutamyl-gamma-aminobutyrate hydrolase PuuD